MKLTPTKKPEVTMKFIDHKMSRIAIKGLVVPLIFNLSLFSNPNPNPNPTP